MKPTTLAQKFGVPQSLVDYISKSIEEETEYQSKVKAHMAKKGIKSLGDLSPEEKKKFFNDLDAAHQAKNEETVKESDGSVVWKKGQHSIEKLADDKYAVYAGDKKGKTYSSLSDAKASISEAVGGGTDVTQIKKSTAAQKKRADIALKIAALNQKQEKEREALQKQKASVKEEVESVDESDAYDKDRYSVKSGKAVKDNPTHKGSANYKDQPHHVWATSPEEALKKKMKKEDIHQDEEVGIEEATGVTDYNAKSQGGTRKELLAKYHKTKNPKDAEAARKAGATQKELQGEEFEVDEACWDTHKQEGMKKKGDKMVPNCVPKNEELEIEEGKSGTGYELYHKDFSSAMAHAYDFAKKKYNIEIDPLEIDRNVAMGPKKPSSGKANAYRLLDKTGKKAIQVQVTNLDNKRYELNMYKEEVELEEKVVKGKGYDNPENDRKAPEGKVPMTSLMPGHNDKAARFAAVQAKGRLVKGKAQSASQKEGADYPEFKQGGEALANKFEKAFSKMGIKTKIKMKTVGNVSVNEAVMKKISKAAKKMKEQAPSDKEIVKSGQTLSGKKEPIEINPEVSQNQR